MLKRIVKKLGSTFKRGRCSISRECALAISEGRPMRVAFGDGHYFINTDQAAVYHAKHSLEKLSRLAACIPQRSDLIIDIGANCGIFSAMARRSHPTAQILAFEPSPSLAEVLDLNCPPPTRVIRKAVSSSTGTVPFFVNPESQQTNSVREDAVTPYGNELQRISVESTTLDDFCRDLQMGEAPTIKIDVQGLESEVVLGANQTMRNAELLIIECTWAQLSTIEAGLNVAAVFPYRYAVNSVKFGADLVFARRPIENAPPNTFTIS